MVYQKIKAFQINEKDFIIWGIIIIRVVKYVKILL